MLRALNSSSSSSFSKLFASRSTLLCFFHLSISSNSKKMEEHRTPSAVQTNLDSRSGRQSIDLHNTAFTVQLGYDANIQLANAIINTGSSGATIQFGSLDYSAFVARAITVSAHGINSEEPIRRPYSTEVVTHCQRKQTSSKRAIGASQEKRPGSESEEGPFDICIPANEGPVKLKKPLLLLNREKRKELECPAEQYLRPGMVLLKKFLGHMDQVKIVSKCRELGIGSGGFYKPGYRDGAKLHLQMMCLGKDWSPESRSYDKTRSFDGAVPPEIPEEFRKLVDRALNTYKFLRKPTKNVEEIPNMSPDICIVNFYSNSGRLGLHQDRDESEESLKKGLPVVSFSIGDSAEFLYSDVRDVDKAKKVLLESGDVLIFGGHARHIFHGVPCIKPNTAPEIFVDETTKLRPGRLNLTFRQY